jgi:hypothetical protein
MYACVYVWNLLLRRLLLLFLFLFILLLLLLLLLLFLLARKLYMVLAF